MNDDPLEQAAAEAGARYGMTAEQLLQHLAIGNVPHPRAPADQCGATDPRDDRKWCAEDKDHRGGHNNFREDDTEQSYIIRFYGQDHWRKVQRSRRRMKRRLLFGGFFDWLLGARCSCGLRVFPRDAARHVARGHWGW